MKRPRGRKRAGTENYLERRPNRRAGLKWTEGPAGTVTLHVPNTGAANRIAQKLFHRPPVTQIHLDQIGSFIWRRLDGERDLIAIGALVEKDFGEKAAPLYERLAKYVQILDSYRLVDWQEDK